MCNDLLAWQISVSACIWLICGDNHPPIPHFKSSHLRNGPKAEQFSQIAFEFAQRDKDGISFNGKCMSWRVEKWGAPAVWITLFLGEMNWNIIEEHRHQTYRQPIGCWRTGRSKNWLSPRRNVVQIPYTSIRQYSENWMECYCLFISSAINNLVGRRSKMDFQRLSQPTVWNLTNHMIKS